MYKLVLCLIGGVCKFTYPRKFAVDLADTFKNYNCVMMPTGRLGEKSGRCSYFVTIPSNKKSFRKESENVNSAVNGYLTIHYKRKIPASALKVVFQGFQYEVNFPVKYVEELTKILESFGCNTYQISQDEGDGMVNVNITIPEKKFVLVQGVLKLYVKYLEL